VVAQSRCGVTVRPGDPRDIARAVRGLAALDPAERAAIGRRGREHVTAHFDYRVLARRFVEAVSA
jgi:glycosyltransferase involved in cell wall biosynthesis